MARLHRYSVRRRVCILFWPVLYFCVIFFIVFVLFQHCLCSSKVEDQSFFFDSLIVFNLCFYLKKKTISRTRGVRRMFFLESERRFVEWFFLDRRLNGRIIGCQVQCWYSPIRMQQLTLVCYKFLKRHSGETQNQTISISFKVLLLLLEY